MKRICPIAPLLLLGLSSGVFAQLPTPNLVARAAQLVADKPTVVHHIGLAEIYRADGNKRLGLEELRKAVKLEPDHVWLQEHLCWRMLPFAPNEREDFRAEVARLKKMEPDNAWAFVWELYLLTRDSDRVALMAALAKPPEQMPTWYPIDTPELVHKGFLRELRVSGVAAGIEVIAARNYEPLYVLRDLDRALTREADYLDDANRKADTKIARKVRDDLRQAYDRSAKHLVEKLFALHLLGDTKERDALLVRAKAFPLLHDRRRLVQLLQRTDDVQALKLVIEPLLASELKFLANPPELGKLEAATVAEIQIKARSKTTAGTTVHYDGEVQVWRDYRHIHCERLTVVNSDNPAAVVISGQDGVRFSGFDHFSSIAAERFTYNAETASFSLGGDVQLKTRDKTVKLRSCTLTQAGELRDTRSWLDDFRNALTLEAKLDLLPRIAKVYDDAELPEEVRYLLALNLLRPHLTWHAPYLPPLPDRHELRDLVRKAVAYESDPETPWQEALCGEAWMLADITPEQQAVFREALQTRYRQINDDAAKRKVEAVLPDFGIPAKEHYFWRLRDPKHADVARAARLLQGIASDELRVKAARWRSEIARNNTVLTFDIAGAAPAGKTHSLLMDVRNAEKVHFKLYRVEQPEELLFSTKHIGRDFLYADHGLDGRGEMKVQEDILKKMARQARDHSNSSTGAKEFQPNWKKEQLVHGWDVCVSDLKHFSRYRSRRYRDWQESNWSSEADAHYFDDECSEHRERIDKDYRPERDVQLSSWQCDRIVQIPQHALARAGGYVLIAESNGQAAHVPIVVEPLSLTLRRCRDGVFVLASDADGTKPLAGADVVARGQVGKSITDKEGAAFARVLALGDRAIIVHHEGRYAIGGFGKVFEGIYETADHERHGLRERLDRARGIPGDAKVVNVYGDRHVVVAYTDRPTYRPGQDVQFKVIVRMLTADKLAHAAAQTFRAEEIDRDTKMVLPEIDQPVDYAVLDPKGREVGQGSLRLSEFGTAAGKVSLPAEAPLGRYALRVRLAGQPRLVPEVFAVEHYRRPNFEVQITGVPAKLIRPETLKVHLSGRYFFGATVTDGMAEVRLVRKGDTKAIVKDSAALDKKGTLKLEVRLPRTLTPGQYLVIGSITDASGRTETATTPVVLEPPDGLQATSGLASLPRFVGVNEEVHLMTTAKEIRAEQRHGDVMETKVVAPRNGIALLKFTAPGWYRVKSGEDEADLFVFGGSHHPREFRHERDDDDVPGLRPRWVNLSDFSHQEDGDLGRWEKSWQHLFALFDRQSLNVGEKLRLLVYVPQKDARLLFTFEGRTIVDYAVMQTKTEAGRYLVIELPIKERFFPNVYLQGRLLPQRGDEMVLEQLKEARKQLERRIDDGDDFDPRWCRIDVAKPGGNTKGTPLNVRIETDRPGYRPGDAVRARIHVTDHAGRPKVAELSLAVVDESVFTVGGDRLDALPGFFAMPFETRRFLPKVWRTSLGSRWGPHHENAQRDLQKAMERLQEATAKQGEVVSKLDLTAIEGAATQSFTVAPLPRLGGEMPAAQLPPGRLREHFQETATWLPQLRTDDAGNAEATFTLPDSLTRYRLTSLALTKGTEVGVGRARISAGLPLAVQVFLPRFAVEKDRLLAVAVVHNNSDKSRECSFTWEIEGATPDGPSPMPEDWKFVAADGKFTGTGRVKAPANGSVKVGAWLKLEKIGAARIAFRANDGKDADAEVRILPVEALGKPAAVNANAEFAAAPKPKPGVQQLTGKFHREGRIQLPTGFLAQELHLNLATSELAQALDGLDYLVVYPHGCIEQTMSRFLPAVMVKHAAHHAPGMLSPGIEKKLPDVLQTGLTRVYGHQHADGSWGWFEKDSRNLAMSVYVLYGLARCKTTGTKVDAAVLERGCCYVLEELRTNNHDPALTARACHALALAGQVPAKDLEASARHALTQSPGPNVACNMALACREAGLRELGERLWAKARGSQPHDTETWAVFLNAQLAFGGKYDDCRATARARWS